MAEQSNTTDLDYGPLQELIGTWRSESGKDVSPEEDGEERNDYREELTFEPLKDLSNAEEQELMVLHYRQTATRIRDGKVIHNECGYYSWDAAQNLIMKSFSIGRGVAIVAGGNPESTASSMSINLVAAKDNKDWGIVESPFMQKKASTKQYAFNLSVEGDTLTYSQTMSLDVFGKQFEHTDDNQLSRVID